MDNKEFYKGMRSHFGITHKANEYLDELLLRIGKVSINLFKLDEWLHSEIGEYETKEGLSMNGVIAKYYGEEAANFVKKFI